MLPLGWWVMARSDRNPRHIHLPFSSIIYRKMLRVTSKFNTTFIDIHTQLKYETILIWHGSDQRLIVTVSSSYSRRIFTIQMVLFGKLCFIIHVHSHNVYTDFAFKICTCPHLHLIWSPLQHANNHPSPQVAPFVIFYENVWRSLAHEGSFVKNGLALGVWNQTPSTTAILFWAGSILIWAIYNLQWRIYIIVCIPCIANSKYGIMILCADYKWRIAEPIVSGNPATHCCVERSASHDPSDLNELVQAVWYHTPDTTVSCRFWEGTIPYCMGYLHLALVYHFCMKER